jgi:hypothetical protein
VLGDAVNRLRFNVVATVSVVAVGILAGVVLVQTVGGWFD